MADLTIANVGEKLIVGQFDTSFATLSSKFKPGTAVLNGPVYMGELSGSIGLDRATCTIGPPLPGLSFPASLEVDGITNIFGVTNTAGIINDLAFSNIFGFTSKTGAEQQTGFKQITALKSNAAVQITQGPKVCQAVATVPLIKADAGIFGTCKADLGVFASVAAPFKQFNIPHPTKSGYRLVHTCLEGPEIGVYYRGRLVNSNVIELPEYWRGLVDAETITVSLTPHTFYQELYVKSIEWGTRITIINNGGGAVDCSYVVYAERKDVPKLEIEPKQEEDKTYPGDNIQ